VTVAEQDLDRPRERRAPTAGRRRLHHAFERTADARPDAVALECDGRRLTYRQLDELANRMAHHLCARGLRAASRAGIMVPRSVDMYVALLGALKAGATFVPIDPSTPADRVDFIARDAGLDMLLTTSALRDVADGWPGTVVEVDAAADDLASASAERPSFLASGDPTCYILYTSGSSGRPKGVEVAQSSICNFVDVVPEIYGVRPEDRVYQGMTISFDFSIEEIWPTWAVGATLVAGPSDGRRVGAPLADFLEESAITMIYCVPTVLATLDRTIDSITTVNVGGEACPPELVQRWGQGRRILNTYGPTEATVTCLWAELEAGKPVTIGRPLPTYTADLLDEDLRPVPRGEVGEICVGGPGVARGYVNLPERTAESFVADPQRPGERIYRTGDLGRYLPNGEIEYLGRADAEVKVRGHRVDLQEIESVLLEDERVSGAVVSLLEDPGTGGELAAYLVVSGGHAADGDLRADLHDRARRRLPAYMVPAYLEEIDEVPMLPSGKVDRASLPAPRNPRLLGGDGEVVSASSPTEERLAGAWAEVLRLPPESVSVEADVFDDLGAHSLTVATLVSRLRSEGAHAALSMLDVYTHPTVRDLAGHLDETASRQAGDGDEDAVTEPATSPPRWWRVAVFGMAQVGWLYVLLVVFLLPIAVVYNLHGGVPSWVVLGQLALALPPTYLLGRWLLPLLGVRLLSRGLEAGTHPLWGRVHLRVWAVQRLMSLSPMTMLAGSPWATTYLRLAGARIGSGCHVGTAEVALPRFVDLADGATIGYATHLRAVEIAEGRLTVGRVEVGRDAVVSASCVVQGPCRIGDGAVLCEQSLLEPDSELPDGRRWAGSPAQPQEDATDPFLDTIRDCPFTPQSWPRALKPRFAARLAALELLPMVALVPLVGLVWWALLTWGEVAALLVTAASGPVFVLTTCLLVLSLRRLALPATEEGVYHLRSRLGMEKWFGDKLLEQSLALNNTLYSTLYTPPWLRALGARVERGAEVSTIANIDPDLLVLHEDCFVADMASVGSAVYAHGHFALGKTAVGPRAFVGNAAFVPSGTQLGEGSLIGVGSVPPTADVAPGTSWLGSPPLFLPKRDVHEEFAEAQTFRPSRRQLRTRYAVEFFRIVLPSSLLALSTFATLYSLSYLTGHVPVWGVVLALPVLAVAASMVVVLLVAAMKWTIMGRYRPRVEPLWSGFVRRTEFVTGMYEAAAVPVLLAFLTGTPLLGPMLRLFGVRVGRRVLLDTTYLTEFDLVRIEDDVSVGPAASLQTHLFEDRVMKMSTLHLRRGVSVGARGVVLYDTELGDEATLAPLSLVMKGERLMARTSWRGIPAQSAPRHPRPHRTRLSPAEGFA
jgi:non-ribosomal peptide synthetase-like protein